MLLELKNIDKIYKKKNYKEVIALRNVSLTIDKGDLVAIVGTSGSGKSTLLNILGGLDSPTSGEYFIKGQTLKSLSDNQLAAIRNKSIGFVVQDFALIKDHTVYENLSLPLEYAKIKKSVRKIRIEDILKKLDISDKIDKFPNELSGGQQQRVAIGRALINKPDIILADEPTGALDGKTSTDIMNLLIQLNKEGHTIVIVTHDEKISKLCNRIIRIEDGKIEEESR